MAEMQKPLSDEEKASAKTVDLVKYWAGQIDSAKKREKEWRTEAHKLIQIYEGEFPEEIPYNILYSNTEILSPALYSQAPRPDTRPRTTQESATAMAAAGLCDAFLENFIDNGSREYCAFSAATKTAVRSALVPGRGVQRFHYHAEIEKDASGPRRVKEESVNVEELAWDKILVGHAQTWIHVPWLAFEHTWSKDEAIEAVGETAAAKLTYNTPSTDEGTTSKREDSSDREPVTTVYEIWHKKKREILWLEQDAKEAFVKKTEPDPYSLEGFYPIQEPLQFMRRLSSCIPVPLYRLYKQQARELNKITRRIEKIVDSLKVRGFFDSGVEGLSKLLEAGDNEMLPISNLAAMGQGAKAENAIWLVPVEKHVTVLQQLLQDRQAVKMVIFEIMGIADIMRGSSVASETLGAQKIKSQWGTLRLKDGQAEVARFIRDGLRIAAELGFSKLGPDTLRRITGSLLPSAEQLAKMEEQARTAQATGKPLSPAVQNTLALPSFEECLEALRSDLTRGYLIDIETNSSADADATEDKENVAEFLNAFSQFLNGVAPLLESGAMPFEAARAIMLSVAKRFNLGRELYRELAKMQAPKAPGGPDPKVVKQLQDAQAKVGQEKAALEKQKNEQSLEALRLKSEREIFEIKKQADAAIQQAKDQSKQAQSTANGAVKSAQEKVATLTEKSNINKLMQDLNALLLKLQTAATVEKERMANHDKMMSERESAKESSENEGISRVESLVQELQKTVADSAKKRPTGAKKGPNGWTFQYSE